MRLELLISIALLTTATTAQASQIYDECKAIYELELAIGILPEGAKEHLYDCVKPPPPVISTDLDVWIPLGQPGGWDDDEFPGGCCGTFLWPNQGPHLDAVIIEIQDWMVRTNQPPTTHFSKYLKMREIFEMDAPANVEDISHFIFMTENAREETASTYVLMEDLVYEENSGRWMITVDLNGYCPRYCQEGYEHLCDTGEPEDYLPYRPMRTTCNMELRAKTGITSPLLPEEEPTYAEDIIPGPWGPTIKFVPEPSKSSGLVAGAMLLGILSRKNATKIKTVHEDVNRL